MNFYTQKDIEFCKPAIYRFSPIS